MRVGMDPRVASSDHGDGGHAQCSPLPLFPVCSEADLRPSALARDDKGPSSLPGPALRGRARTGRAPYSHLTVQLPLCLIPCAPGGVALPAGLPVPFGAHRAPGLIGDSGIGAVLALARFLGDLALFPALLPVVFLPFWCLASGPFVFLPLFGRLRGPWLVGFLGPRVRCPSVSKCIF